jgi:YHS domain-containing protein
MDRCSAWSCLGCRICRSSEPAASTDTTRRVRIERNDLEDVMAVDPVCKMTVDENKAAGKSEYNGKTYYFCATSCKTRFDKEPAKYAS